MNPILIPAPVEIRSNPAALGAEVSHIFNQFFFSFSKLLVAVFFGRLVLRSWLVLKMRTPLASFATKFR